MNTPTCDTCGHSRAVHRLGRCIAQPAVRGPDDLGAYGTTCDCPRFVGRAPDAVQQHRPLRCWLGPHARLPTQAHRGDAGYDLYTSESVNIEPHTFVDVPTGVHVELPIGMWALIIGRSSTLRERDLLVQQGVIDNGYRGELFVACWNMSGNWHFVQAGDRLGQLVLIHNQADQYEPTEVETLAPHERGLRGFGSTGR